MMQKFHRYDHVQIAKDLGESMSHFKKDTDAIVLGSYRDHYGHGATDNYVLYVNGCGESSWYKECQLTLIDKNGKELLQKWEDAAEKGGLVTPDLKKVFKTFCHGCIFVSCSQYEKYGYDFIRKANGNPNTKIIVVDDERFAEMTFDEKMRLATGR